jgi:hypothetical protein
MNENFYRTGQVAKQLGISSYRVRALCETGLIPDAGLTEGGQWIVPASAVQKLSRDGVPPTPKTIDTTAVSANGGGRPVRRNPNPLIAKPSTDAVDAAEDSFINERKLAADTHKLARMRVRREGLELQDWFESREQAKIQRELDEDRRREEYAERQIQQRRAELAAEERRRVERKWLAYAIEQKRFDSPEDYVLLIKPEVSAALAEIAPDESDYIVQRSVDAAIARALAPWRSAREKRQAKRGGIESALATLPLEMRWNSDWSAQARKIASDAADGARDDAGVSDIAAAAKGALRPLIAQHQHLSKIIDAAEHVILPNGSREEDQEAREAVRQALANLPIGAGDRAIDQAKQAALAPIRARISERIEARQRKDAKERLIATGLTDIYWHANNLIEKFDFEGESAFTIELMGKPVVLRNSATFQFRTLSEARYPSTTSWLNGMQAAAHPIGERGVAG